MGRKPALILAAGAFAAGASGRAMAAPSHPSAYPVLPPRASLPLFGGSELVRRWTIDYRAHDGLLRHAYVLLPRWYGPHRNPPLPLVISPHGRGVPAVDNAKLWGNLPSLGRFAVINPEGQGRRFPLYSWGDPGEIRDLARMPSIAQRRLPWLRIERSRVYAVGGSMGGQETLLLVARFPRLLAGAAAFDSPANLAARYAAFRLLPFGRSIQDLARAEVGGPPWVDPRAWDVRSPIDWARAIAYAGVPLQIWWSRNDRIVVDQRRQSGSLYRVIKRLNPDAPVVQFAGTWAHSAEFKATRRLPYALALFGLMPPYDLTPPRRSYGNERSRSDRAARAGHLRDGELALLLATGTGYTWAASVVRGAWQRSGSSRSCRTAVSVCARSRATTCTRRSWCAPSSKGSRPRSLRRR